MTWLARIVEEVRERGVKFLLMGLVNSLFGYACYALCTYLGLGYFWSTAIAMICGTIFNYLTSRTVVFRGWRGSFLKYAASYGIVLAVSVACLHGFDSLGIDPYLGGILVAIPAAATSY